MGAHTQYLELMLILLTIFQPQKLMKHVDTDLIFEEKRQKALEKKRGCKFIRIYTSKEGYDADYEANRIKTFISKLKDRKLKNYKKN